MITYYLLFGGGWLIRFVVIHWGISPYRFYPHQRKMTWTLAVALIPLAWLFFLLSGWFSRDKRMHYGKKK